MRSQSQESLVSMPVKSAAGQEMGGEESTNAPSEKEKAEGQRDREKWCLNIYTIMVEDIGTQ